MAITSAVGSRIPADSAADVFQGAKCVRARRASGRGSHAAGRGEDAERAEAAEWQTCLGAMHPVIPAQMQPPRSAGRWGADEAIPPASMPIPQPPCSLRTVVVRIVGSSSSRSRSPRLLSPYLALLRQPRSPRSAHVCVAPVRIVPALPFGREHGDCLVDSHAAAPASAGPLEDVDRVSVTHMT